MHSASQPGTGSQPPGTGEVFLDARGGSRALRVSWHLDVGVVVLSIWRAGTCAGTFRLVIDEVPDLVGTLREGLARAYDDASPRELSAVVPRVVGR